MKSSTLLLIASLAANVALVAVVSLRMSNGPASRAMPSSFSGKDAVPPSSSATPQALRAALASGNAAALEAAGIPADLARELALGHALGRVAAKMRAAQSHPGGDDRWWRNRSASSAGSLSREQTLQAKRELSEAMIAAFGDDLGIGGGDNSQLGFLSPAKRDALRRINQDYDEMFAKFGAGGVQLASDREKLRLLRAERDRDIASVLSPDEVLNYELRTSPTALSLRNRFGEAIESEEDFRRIYALQKAFDEKFPAENFNGRVLPDAIRQRADAQRQLQEDMRTALGDDKYAALRRASDFEIRSLESLVTRLNLPADTTSRVVASRDSYAAESQRINADASLGPPQRRAQIQELGNRAKADLAATLGSEAADAYAQRSPWLSMLQGGTAFSTNPKDSPMGAGGMGGPSVFPVMPAGGNAAGATRQVINFVGASPAGDSGGTAGTLFLGGTAPIQRTTDSTYFFSTTAPGSGPATNQPPSTSAVATPANPPSATGTTTVPTNP